MKPDLHAQVELAIGEMELAVTALEGRPDPFRRQLASSLMQRAHLLRQALHKEQHPVEDEEPVSSVSIYEGSARAKRLSEATRQGNCNCPDRFDPL